jgi:membrane-associated phospholipid phosphatase
MILTAAALLIFFSLWLLLFVTGSVTRPVLPRLAHWTASFRYRDFMPVFVLVAGGALVALLAGDGFIDLAERVHENSPRLAQVDRNVHEWAALSRDTGHTAFFMVATRIGDPIVLGVFVLLAAIPLVMAKRWRWLGYLLVTTGVGALLNLALKSYFARSRPDLAEALRNAHGYSFPSGHAMGATVVFGALAYLAFRVVPRWKWRTAAMAAAITITLCVAASRVYLGVHWISDVGAGMTAGVIWLTVVTVAYEAFRRIRMIRSLRSRRAKT